MTNTYQPDGRPPCNRHPATDRCSFCGIYKFEGVSLTLATSSLIATAEEAAVDRAEGILANADGHDCWDEPVPYEFIEDGHRYHGWECGRCGEFLQAG